MTFPQFALLIKLTGSDRSAAALWHLIYSVAGAKRRRVLLADLARELLLSERTAQRTVSRLVELGLVSRRRTRKSSGKLGSYEVSLTGAASAFAAAFKKQTEPRDILSGGEQAEMPMLARPAGDSEPHDNLAPRIREDKRSNIFILGGGANAPLCADEIRIARAWLDDLPEDERLRRIHLLNSRIVGYDQPIKDRQRFLLASLEKDRSVAAVRKAQSAAERAAAERLASERVAVKETHLSLDRRAASMREQSLRVAEGQAAERLRAARLKKYEEFRALGLDPVEAQASVDSIYG